MACFLGLMACSAHGAQVDVKVMSVTWTPLLPTNGQEVVFDITVHNAVFVGNTVTTDFAVASELSVDEEDAPFKTYAVDLGDVVITRDLAPQETFTTQRTWVATTDSGHFSLRARVDPLDVVDESNEDNNVSYVPYRDLVVKDIVWDPPAPSNGQTVTFMATITNAGTVDIDEDFHVRFEVNGAGVAEPLVTNTVPRLGSLGVTATWVQDTASFTVQAIADSRDVVTEDGDGEINNAYVSRFGVGAPDYVVEDIRYDVDDTFGWGYKAVILNQGADSLRGTAVRWQVDGADQGVTSIGGLASGERAETMIPLRDGDLIRVECDASNVVAEASEVNNAREEPLMRPDLLVSDIWWSPAAPLDGEEVTFYALVQNHGAGGSVSDYDVRFTVDAGESNEVVLGTARVADDALPAQRSVAVANGDFETGDLSGWTLVTGAAAEVRARYERGNEHCLYVQDAVVRSGDFVLSAENLAFSAYVHGASWPGWLRVKRASDGVELKAARLAQGGSWHAYVVDVAAHVGETVYVEADAATSSYYCYLDDLRMSADAGAVVTVSAPGLGGWTATSGTNHTITVEADVGLEVPETNETNQVRVETFGVGAPDYVVEDIRYDVDDVFGWGYKAVILNQGADSVRGTAVRWSVDGADQGVTSIGGLASGERAETMIPLRDGDLIRVECDASNAVAEASEANNAREEPLMRPDLSVSDIWWSPAAPVDGEEVTFYALVQNLGVGGSVSDYDVRFTVDAGGSNEVVLGTARVTDDVLPAQRSVAVSNGDFETGDLSGWTLLTGVVAEGRARSDRGNEHGLYVQDAVARSGDFVLSAENLAFSAYVHGPSWPGWLRVKRASDGVELKAARLAQGGSWHAYVVDVAAHVGETVYVEVDAATSSYYCCLDDLRMSADAGAVVTVSAPALGGWTATSGTNHTITVEADIGVEVPETNETNQLRVETFGVGAPDYVVEDIRYDVDDDFGWGYKAVILNQGADSLRETAVRWSVDGVDQGVTSIGGLASGERAETMIPLRDGDLIRVECDASNAVGEANEANNTLEVPLMRPDLSVSDIWWSPAAPLDGEEVTFYALVDNLGAGGSVSDYDVRFTVDAGESNEVVLGTARVGDDVLPAQRSVAVANGDFETGDLAGWTLVTGATAEVRARYERGNEHCLYVQDAVVRSGDFVLSAENLAFSGYVHGPSWPGWLRVKRAADGTELKAVRLAHGGSWHAYVVDMASNIGETVYVEVDAATSSYYCYLDDLRMSTDADAVVTVSAPGLGGWTATSGTNHTITVEADVGLEVPETNETNQVRVETFGVGAPDYVVEDIRYDVDDGFGWGYKAVILNQGADSLRPTAVRWQVDGSDHGVTSIGGLASGERAETMIPLRDGDLIRVECDASNAVGEANEANNTLEVPLMRPDLSVSDIWWSPAAPLDGEEVTFYALVDNLGAGGSVSDYDVRFTVDAGESNEVVLGTVRVADDVLPAQRSVAVANGDFETGDLTGWTLVTGAVAEVRARYERGNEHCLYVQDAVVRSGDFVLSAENLAFSGYVHGASWPGWLRVKRASDGTELKAVRLAHGGSWHAYVVDVASNIGETVYVEVDAATSSYYCYLDDLRMSTDADAVVTVSAPGLGGWTATSGTNHTITVEADVGLEVPETNETNQARVETFGVGAPDYVVEDIRYDVDDGFGWGYKAVILNQGADSLRPTAVRWSVDGADQGVTSIGGLASGERAETMIPLRDGDLIRVECDASNAVAEANETNNALGEPLMRPDLSVSDTWWSPVAPLDGEEVTFYALIENLGAGGSASDYDVRFTVDAGASNEVVLGTARVADDVLPAQRFIAVANGDFETGDLTGWTLVTGATAEVRARYERGNEHCLYVQDAVVRSPSFTLAEENLAFCAYVHGASWPGWLRVKRAADGTELKAVRLAHGGSWHAYVVDVASNIGETVYVEVDAATSSYYCYLDDLRMSTDAGAVLTVSAPALGGWTATSGTNHTITVEADVGLEVPETNETNQVRVETFGVGAPDYVVEDIRYDVDDDFGWGYKAVILNQGADSLRETAVRWSVDGVDQGVTSIGGLASGERAETMIPLRDGDLIRVECDASNVVAEASEANNALEEPLMRPDLSVSDIWWSPAAPLDGEEVAFYALVQNLGAGGSVSDYDVRFTVDAGESNEVVLGTVRVADDVLPAQRSVAVANGDFETGDLSGWTLVTGAAAEVRSRYERGNEHCLYVQDAVVRSDDFTLTEENLEFGAYVHGASWPGWLRVRRASDGVELKAARLAQGGSWHAYVVDVAAHVGETVYVEVDAATSSYYCYLDDLRMSADAGVVVTVSAPALGGWTATSGTNHTITVEVDVGIEVPETNETNQVRVETFGVGAPDYVVEDIRYDVDDGFGWGYKAVILNQGADSLRPTAVRWQVDGTDQGVTSIGGLASGERAETMIPLRDGDLIRVECDASNVVAEASEANNALEEPLMRPDLSVSDIWWSPVAPLDGEEVTFYALIENLGAGGSVSDYEVRFTVDAGESNEVVLGTARVGDDVLPAQRSVAVANGDFETGDLTGWTLVTGATAEVRSRYERRNEHCLYVQDAVVRSGDFVLSAENLAFSGYVHGSSWPGWLRVKRASDGVELKAARLAQGGSWHAYVVDVASNIGETVYVEVDAATSSYYCYLDDLRMSTDAGAVVTVSAPAMGGWTATSGTNHTITVEVDVGIEVPETNETNQVRVETFGVGAPDYVVEDIRYDVDDDFGWGYKAVILNQGADSLRPTAVRWSVDGADQGVTAIGGLASGERAETMIPLRGGDLIRVECDASNAVAEASEANNARDEPLMRPDLSVSDIWWSPAAPLDGEEVTFYALVDNLGAGGSVSDYDVRFTVDAGESNEVVLGTVRVADDVLPAQRSVAVANGDFETGDLTGWTLVTGAVAEVRARYERGNEHCLYVQDAVVRSGDFVLSAENLAFSGYVHGASWPGWLRVKRASDGTELKAVRLAHGGSWRAYVVDVASNIGETVYVEVDAATSSYYCYLDDLRMSAAAGAVLTVSAPALGGWTATSGTNHTITVEADVGLEVPETNETNQVRVETLGVGAPDYVVEDIRYDVDDVFGWGYKAVILNQGADSLRGTAVRWQVDGADQGVTSIGGLASGERAETMLAFRDGDLIRVECDASNVVAEASEVNNAREEPLARPDLSVGEIWWSPANPLDGEEVTFYALVQNHGAGGSVSEFDVRFTVDAGESNEVVLGTARVVDDILPAQRPVAVVNGDFEMGDLSGWTLVTGATAEVRTRYDRGDEHCLYVRDAVVRSGNFVLSAESLAFSAYVHGPSWPGWLRVKRASDGTELKAVRLAHGGSWHAYVADVEAHVGETVYVEVDAATSRYYCYLDDLRIGVDAGDAVTVSVPALGGWTATPGNHTVLVELDVGGEIEEAREGNNGGRGGWPRGTLDTDGDGLPDEYELDYSGTATGMAWWGDPDADGRNNLEEYHQGTDPIDAASCFRIEGLQVPDMHELEIEWTGSLYPSGPDRYTTYDGSATFIYVMQSSSNLHDWAETSRGLRHDVPLVITNTAPHGYYRFNMEDAD